MLVGVRRTGAIQFIKVLLLYGTPTNGVYSSSMAAKKRSSSKPPTPIKLSNIKGVTKTNKPAGSAVGGKKYKTPKNAQPAYSGPKVTGSKTPIKQSGKGFANSGGTLSSGLAGSNLSKGNVAKTILTVAAVPTKAAIAPASYGAKLLGKAAGRYGGAGVRGAADATYTSATKGLSNIRPGGQLYMANTVTGKQLASTKVMSPRRVKGATSGLVKRAENITDAAVRGGRSEVASTAQKDYNRISRIAREGLPLAAVEANKSRKNKRR